MYVWKNRTFVRIAFNKKPGFITRVFYDILLFVVNVLASKRYGYQYHRDAKQTDDSVHSAQGPNIAQEKLEQGKADQGSAYFADGASLFV